MTLGGRLLWPAVTPCNRPSAAPANNWTMDRQSGDGLLINVAAVLIGSGAGGDTEEVSYAIRRNPRQSQRHLAMCMPVCHDGKR